MSEHRAGYLGHPRDTTEELRRRPCIDRRPRAWSKLEMNVLRYVTSFESRRHLEGGRLSRPNFNQSIVESNPMALSIFKTSMLERTIDTLLSLPFSSATKERVFRRTSTIDQHFLLPRGRFSGRPHRDTTLKYVRPRPFVSAGVMKPSSEIRHARRENADFVVITTLSGAALVLSAPEAELAEHFLQSASVSRDELARANLGDLLDARIFVDADAKEARHTRFVHSYVTSRFWPRQNPEELDRRLRGWGPTTPTQTTPPHRGELTLMGHMHPIAIFGT